jgi:hypothetical protein
MRVALLALALHKAALTQPYLALLSKHLTGFPFHDTALVTLLLKQIKATLPHSLNLLTALPAELVRACLGKEGGVEVDLRKPVREYLYGLPPSVRSRYQHLLRLLEE